MLAGDALLTDAFTEASHPSDLEETERLIIVRCLSRAVGGNGMVLGQDREVFWTGKERFAIENLDQIHLNKTAKLISSACQTGDISAGADENISKSLYDFGLLLGHRFQILDDLLDTKEGTGKSKGKYVEQSKLTYRAVMPDSEAQSMADTMTRKAFTCLDALKNYIKDLSSVGDALLSRNR